LTFNKEDSKINVKIWDFHNKEVTYGCYSLFLVRRAVIVVTLDVRHPFDEVVAMLKTVQVRWEATPFSLFPSSLLFRPPALLLSSSSP
jgi:hypothetical protein